MSEVKPISQKVKQLLAGANKSNTELANYLGISPQSCNNKLSRGSFSIEDIIKICDFTGAELKVVQGGTTITFGLSDVRE